MSKVLLYLCAFVITACIIKYFLEGDIEGASGIALSGYLLWDELRKQKDGTKDESA